MTKTCGRCGHAGLDDHAQFCNRCGAPVPEEIKPAFPVCSACGAVISDELAQFCNRCGAKTTPVPVVCSTCGSPAVDSQSRFCTRCGTTFEQRPVHHTPVCPSCGTPDPQGQSLFCNRCGTPFSRPGIPAANLQGQHPPVVTQRKQPAPLPPVLVPDTDWEPWNDVPPAHTLSVPAAPEQPVIHDHQISVNQKRYAHLPLVAEEMKKKPDTGAESVHAQDIPHIPPRKKQPSQKKGVLGFLKK